MRNEGLTRYFYFSPCHCDSNKVLEIPQSSNYNRGKICLGNLRPGSPNQLFAFAPAGDGFNLIINKASIKVFDACVDDAKMAFNPGTEVYVYDINLGLNQHWRIKKASGFENGVHILSRLANFALDVNEYSTGYHARIGLWNKHDNPNQIWRLIRA